MQAVRDAALAAGRYPVVVYAPSLSASAFENADLCEYLASHGYVVVASPDMGTHARGMSIDLEGAETQARDISFLIGFARTLPDTDLSAVAVAGFSWGGISNLLAAARDNRVKVLVSLDGSARYYPKLTEEAKYVVPESLTIPVLFFTQQNRSLEELSGTPAMSRNVLLRLTHCDLTIVRMDAMSHRHFASLFNRSPKIWNDTPREDYSSEEVSTSYGWVARYTERFLAARLKGDAAAAGFIAATPAKNGVPPHVVKIDFRPAQGPPRAKDKNFKIEEDKINTWGYGLLELNCVPQAIEVFKLNVSLYPDAWNTYDSLADGYRVNGQKDLAIKFYKKAIEMNPKDVNGVARLKDLR
jgi:dienelactone hydrolase